MTDEIKFREEARVKFEKSVPSIEMSLTTGGQHFRPSLLIKIEGGKYETLRAISQRLMTITMQEFHENLDQPS